jgi:hypothetical protein
MTNLKSGSSFDFWIFIRQKSILTMFGVCVFSGFLQQHSYGVYAACGRRPAKSTHPELFFFDFLTF